MRLSRHLLAGLLLASLILGACAGQRGSSSSVPPGYTAAAGAVRQTQSVVPLGSYNIDTSKVFVSGISSGAFFTSQIHFAYSGTFKGAAVYAGGVDYCAQDSATTALNACGGNGSYSSELAPSENFINQNQNTSGMDPVSNISGQPVYLWSGTKDTVVPQASMNDLQSEYQHYGANVTYDNSFAAVHSWESPKGPNPCASMGNPYVITCNDTNNNVYDSEKVWLTKFYGTLNPKNTGTLGGSFINFDQTQFNNSGASMDTNGWVYVPKNCANGSKCSIIVALHGCLMTQADIQQQFVHDSGLNEWADTNNIIVLYPEAVKSTFAPSNPNGCWDWWGYTNANYALKSGVQMASIYSMVKRLEAGTATPTPTPAPTGPTPTPSPTPVATPTPTPTPTSLGCFTDNNYNHSVLGRAYVLYGYTFANGSNQNMGLWNIYTTTSLNETAPNYYVIVPHC